MQILVKSGNNFYEELTLQDYSAYFMNTLRPAKETYAEDGKTKTHKVE
jgi:hypothetical protein